MAGKLGGWVQQFSGAALPTWIDPRQQEGGRDGFFHNMELGVMDTTQVQMPQPSTVLTEFH